MKIYQTATSMWLFSLFLTVSVGNLIIRVERRSREIMPRFNPRDVREIIDMLEDGITSVRKLGKVEKMRGKIRRQDGLISALSNPSAEMIYQRLEQRRSDLFPLYSYDVKEKLRRLLEEKSRRVRSM